MGGGGEREKGAALICKVSGYLHIDGTFFPTNQKDPEAKLVVVGGGGGTWGRGAGGGEREREKDTCF